MEIREQREYDVEDLQKMARRLELADLQMGPAFEGLMSAKNEKEMLARARSTVLRYVTGSRRDGMWSSTDTSYVATDGDKVVGFLSYDRSGEHLEEPILLNVLFTDPALSPSKLKEAKKMLENQYLDAE
jgi:hypothetical protein